MVRFVKEVMKGYPLSWTRVVDQTLNFGDKKVKSIEIGMAYLRLVHNGQKETAEKLLGHEEYQFLPWKIPDFVEETMDQVNWRFEVQADVVVEKILREQVRQPGNPYRVEMERILENAKDPQKVQFRVYGSRQERDTQWGCGFKPHEWSGDPSTFNIYAGILTRILEDLYDGNLRETESIDDEFQALITDGGLFQPSASRSALVLTDSHGGYTSEVVGGRDAPEQAPAPAPAAGAMAPAPANFLAPEHP